jgi:hypothetical protein
MEAAPLSSQRISPADYHSEVNWDQTHYQLPHPNHVQSPPNQSTSGHATLPPLLHSRWCNVQNMRIMKMQGHVARTRATTTDLQHRICRRPRVTTSSQVRDNLASRFMIVNRNANGNSWRCNGRRPSYMFMHGTCDVHVQGT